MAESQQFVNPQASIARKSSRWHWLHPRFNGPWPTVACRPLSLLRRGAIHNTIAYCTCISRDLHILQRPLIYICTHQWEPHSCRWWQCQIKLSELDLISSYYTPRISTHRCMLIPYYKCWQSDDFCSAVSTKRHYALNIYVLYCITFISLNIMRYKFSCQIYTKAILNFTLVLFHNIFSHT